MWSVGCRWWARWILWTVRKSLMYLHIFGDFCWPWKQIKGEDLSHCETVRDSQVYTTHDHRIMCSTDVFHGVIIQQPRYSPITYLICYLTFQTLCTFFLNMPQIDLFHSHSCSCWEWQQWRYEPSACRNFKSCGHVNLEELSVGS